jgi:hypothetical protein
VHALFERGGVRPIRVRSVLMYTIKILQRLIDCGTHNSIFAFVLLILKNHFQRASLPAENQSAIPSFSKSPGPAPRLPPPDLQPGPVSRHGRPSNQKGKLPETRLSKNTAPELCGRTFFQLTPRSFHGHSAQTFVRLEQPRIREGR